MNKLKENASGIVMFLIEILIGILLLIRPVGFTKTIIIGSGAILAVMGIVRIIEYFKTNIEDAVKEQPLSTGLIFLVSGLFCAFRSNFIIATFPILTLLYGVAIFLMGLKKVQWTIDAIRLKRKYWFIIALNALLSIIFGIIVLNNPFKTTAVLWQWTGIILIVAAILDIIMVSCDGTKNVK